MLPYLGETQEKNSSFMLLVPQNALNTFKIRMMTFYNVFTLLEITLEREFHLQNVYGGHS